MSCVRLSILNAENKSVREEREDKIESGKLGNVCTHLCRMNIIIRCYYVCTAITNQWEQGEMTMKPAALKHLSYSESRSALIRRE